MKIVIKSKWRFHKCPAPLEPIECVAFSGEWEEWNAISFNCADTARMNVADWPDIREQLFHLHSSGNTTLCSIFANDVWQRISFYESQQSNNNGWSGIVFFLVSRMASTIHYISICNKFKFKEMQESMEPINPIWCSKAMNEWISSMIYELPQAFILCWQKSMFPRVLCGASDFITKTTISWIAINKNRKEKTDEILIIYIFILSLDSLVCFHMLL